MSSRRQFISALSALTVAARAAASEDARPPAPTLRKAGTGAARVDAQGFIRRWMVLDPVSTNGRLTMPEVESAITQWALPWNAASLPADGDSAGIGGEQRTWHALDTSLYNLNLYHFAWSRSQPTSNVLFWAWTAIDAPQEIREARLAIGSNAASIWWLNDQRVIALYNDRQTVIDDGVSRRVTLPKGRSFIRTAIINGGGATDFCARFLDARDRPITGLTVRLGP